MKSLGRKNGSDISGEFGWLTRFSELMFITLGIALPATAERSGSMTMPAGGVTAGAGCAGVAC